MQVYQEVRLFDDITLQKPLILKAPPLWVVLIQGSLWLMQPKTNSILTKDFTFKTGSRKILTTLSMRMQVFLASVLDQKKAHACSQWVQVWHKESGTPKLPFQAPISFPEGLGLTIAQLTPTQPLPKPLSLQSVAFIATTPLIQAELIALHAATTSSTSLILHRQQWSCAREAGR